MKTKTKTMLSGGLGRPYFQDPPSIKVPSFFIFLFMITSNLLFIYFLFDEHDRDEDDEKDEEDAEDLGRTYSQDPLLIKGSYLFFRLSLNLSFRFENRLRSPCRAIRLS